MVSCSQDEATENIIEDDNTENPIEEEDENDEEEIPTEPNSLKSFTVDKNGDIYSFYFHYYNNKIDKLAYVNELEEITYYSLEYNSTSHKIEETIKHSVTSNNTEIDFTDSNNFMDAESSVFHSYHDNNELHEIAGYGYAYNGGFVSQIMDTSMFPTTNIFYDASGKIERTETYEYNQDPGFPQFFEFDSKNNPFFYLFDEFGLVIDKSLSIPNNGSIPSAINKVLKDAYCISPYNILEKTEYMQNGIPSYKVEYTYNNDDYPLEGIFIYDGENQQGIIKYTINFDYY